MLLQLHRDPKPVLPVNVRRLGSPLHRHGPKRRDRDALLGAKGPSRVEAKSAPNPRIRRERAVAMGGPHPPRGASLQRVRARPRVLRRVLHGPTGARGAVPG